MKWEKVYAVRRKIVSERAQKWNYQGIANSECYKIGGRSEYFAQHGKGLCRSKKCF